VPYLNCPSCGLTLYSAAAYSTKDVCPRCGRALSRAAAQRPSRPVSLVRAGEHRFRLSGGPAAPAAARQALGELAVPTQAPHGKLGLLVSELVTNSVKYAPAGPAASLDLHVGVSDGAMRVEVSDDGDGFQPGRLGPKRDLTSGWGLYLVDALADRWGVAQDKPTRVWFELRWRRGRTALRDSTPPPRPQVAAVRDALNRLAGPAGMRHSRSLQQRRQQGRLDQARIQDWLRRLRRD
jgi:anti-sigma regulatory factor (Ser/Thr protein kinase)